MKRFHQTLKKLLAAQPPAGSLPELQQQIDPFITYYNDVRPCRAIARRTPAEAYAARVKATPQANGHPPGRHYRVRHDKADGSGTVKLRYKSQLHHVGLGRAHKSQRVLVANRDVRVLSVEGPVRSAARLCGGPRGWG